MVRGGPTLLREWLAAVVSNVIVDMETKAILNIVPGAYPTPTNPTGQANGPDWFRLFTY